MAGRRAVIGMWQGGNVSHAIELTASSIPGNLKPASDSGATEYPSGHRSLNFPSWLDTTCTRTILPRAVS